VNHQTLSTKMDFTPKLFIRLIYLVFYKKIIVLKVM